jgi:hypothetical protein
MLDDCQQLLLSSWVRRTLYVAEYHADGTIVEYDLQDPKTPLPAFRALVPIGYWGHESISSLGVWHTIPTVRED